MHTFKFMVKIERTPLRFYHNEQKTVKWSNGDIKFTKLNNIYIASINPIQSRLS